MLKEFNAAFKRRRMEATMSGKGFMTYATAMTRLRRAPIPMLVNRQSGWPGAIAVRRDIRRVATYSRRARSKRPPRRRSAFERSTCATWRTAFVYRAA